MQQNHLATSEVPWQLKKKISQMQTFYFNLKRRLILHKVGISLQFTELTHHTRF